MGGSFGVYAAMKQLIDPGKWDECSRIDSAHYCLMRSGIPIPTTTSEFPSVLGVCAPSSCSASTLASFSYGELRDPLGLPSLGRVIDSQRNLTFACRTLEEPNGGTWAMAYILCLLVVIVASSSVLDAILSSRVVEAFITHQRYDADNTIVIEEYTPFELHKDSDYFTEDEGSVQKTNLRHRESTPLLSAAHGKPSEVANTIAASAFKITSLQTGLCYVIQFFYGVVGY